MNIFLFKEQVNNKGYYCEIATNHVYNESEPSQLIVSYKGDHRWQAPAENGATIFFNYFTKLYKGKLEVDIEVTKWRPVDTNHTIIQYAAIMALSKQLNTIIPNVSFDITNGTFTFP